jgi:hypothetical protein
MSAFVKIRSLSTFFAHAARTAGRLFSEPSDGIFLGEWSGVGRLRPHGRSDTFGGIACRTFKRRRGARAVASGGRVGKNVCDVA